MIERETAPATVESASYGFAIVTAASTMTAAPTSNDFSSMRNRGLWCCVRSPSVAPPTKK